MARKKYVNQLPTQSVILPYIKKKSTGVEGVEIYEKTGLSCYTWQKINPIDYGSRQERFVGSPKIWIFHSSMERKI